MMVMMWYPQPWVVGGLCRLRQNQANPGLNTVPLLYLLLPCLSSLLQRLQPPLLLSPPPGLVAPHPDLLYPLPETLTIFQRQVGIIYQSQASFSLRSRK